jgi:hypothetical protein
MSELRERTLIEMFGALEGIYGANYECKYHPCHFSGQDCSFCYCPFYPCLNYDFGGELKVTENGYLWDCQNCWWIHEIGNVEDVIFSLSKFPKQRLIEENWVFYNRILQELYYGEELGQLIDDVYNLIPAIFHGKECESIDNTEFISVRLGDFTIESITKISSIEEATNGVLIPIKEGRKLYGVLNGKPVVCRLTSRKH